MELRHTATRTGRLSSFLKQEMGLSTGLMNRLKWQNKICVNGVPRFANFQVQSGDVITAILDDPAPEYPAEDAPIDIIYEDEHILAVDKPAGMLIHPSRNRMTGTLANAVIGYYNRTGQRCAFHPVTRLDRDTFGIVLLAKNSHIHALFQETPMEKTYHALTFGGPTGGGGDHRSAYSQKRIAQPAPGGPCRRKTLRYGIHSTGTGFPHLQAGTASGYRQDPSASCPLQLYGLSHIGRPPVRQ